MSITDKELLAICNLSNLKMEFANLKKDIETTEDSQGENYTNHTIYKKTETFEYVDLLEILFFLKVL